MSAPLLDIRTLDVVYGNSIRAVRGISLSVMPGETVALLGSNGAGKTSTLKAISGLLPYENGKLKGGVTFDSIDISGLPPHKIVRAGMFHCREGRQIFTDLSVEDNLRAAARGGGRETAANMDMVFGHFPRLKERLRQRAGYLSGGEQQMLAIGRALMAGPRMLILDEPSMGLAPNIVQDIFQTLMAIVGETGLSLLLVEQNANVALAHAHRGYIMENGQILLTGDAATLRADENVREAYLGGSAAGGERKSYRQVKHYRTSRRWQG